MCGIIPSNESQKGGCLTNLMSGRSHNTGPYFIINNSSQSLKEVVGCEKSNSFTFGFE